jgi:hypothetical protein
LGCTSKFKESVYDCWELWPECLFPETKPVLSVHLQTSILSFLSLVPCTHYNGLVHPGDIPNLLWCHSNWTQLEIATRRLALGLDDFFYKYDVPNSFESSTTTCKIYDRKIELIKHINALNDCAIQLYWWLCALM